MTHARSAALWIAALCLFAPAMQAAQVTFAASGVTQDGSTLSGYVVIDTVAGSVISASLTMSGALSFTVSSVDTHTSGEFNGTYGLQANNGSTFPLVGLDLPISTLAGYTGGNICTVASPCPNQGFSEASASNPTTSHFVSGSLTPVPALSCATRPAFTPTVRAEGFTELVGDLVLDCTGGTPTAAGQPIPQANLSIFLNTSVTSRLLQAPNVPEALLLIDEPGATGSLAQQQLACVSPTTGCAINGTGGAAGTTPYSGASGRPNIFQGMVNGNSVSFFGVPVDPAGSGHRILRFTNIRANATTLAGGGGSPIEASLSVNPPNLVPVVQPIQTLAQVQPGLSFSVRDGADAGALSAALALQQGTSHALSSAPSVVVRFSEQFPTAFRNRTSSNSPSTPANQNVPGVVTNTESGFTFAMGNQTAGLADAGTRLKATFSSIPAGVRVFVGVVNLGGPFTQATLTTGENSPFAAVPSTDTVNGVRVVEIPVVSGNATAVWEVVNANPAALENYDFPVLFVGTLSATGTGSVRGDFAPSSPGAFAASAGGSAQSNLPIPRFAGGSGAPTAVLTVTPVPATTVLSSNPASLSFTVRAGAAPVAQTIAVSASGASSILNFTTSVSGLSALSTPSGTNTTPANVSITLNPAGLAPGTYSGSVVLTSASAANSPLTIPVTLVITPPAGPYITTQILSHIADGAGWKTGIILLNTGTAPANFTLRFWDESGNPWRLSLGADGAQSQITDTIPVGGSRTIQTDGSANFLAVGSADVSAAAGTIGGTAVFALQIPNQPDTEAAVPTTAIRGRRFLLPFDNTPGFATGVAIANPSSTQTATVSVTFRNQAGQVRGTAGPFTLTAHGHTSFVIPTSAGALGVAEFTSPDVDIAGLGIRSHGRAFTSVETLASVLPGGKTMTHIADGGGWKTTIILVNSGSDAAPFTLHFRQDNGTALNLSLGADGSASTLSDTIAPGGSRIVQTDGTASNLATGWADLVTTFAVGGTAIFGAQVPGQPDSEAAVPILPGGGNHFVLPFDGSPNFGTGIAFANPSGTVSANISTILRDVSGQQIATQPNNPVPADGHNAFVVPTTVKGVADISSPNTPVSALGIRSHNGAFTSVRSLVILPGFDSVVAGVKTILSGGNPGPVQGTNPGDWVTLASGGATESSPSSYVLARTFGQGRVAAVGHEGLLINAQLQDNGLFLANLVTWLDTTVRKKACYTTGHAEFVNAANSGPLGTALAGQGVALQNLTGTISPSSLASCSVLIVGNGWNSFTTGEIQTVQDFVTGGGGLLMAGLGWSWLPNNPTLTQADYPMLKLAQPFGVTWLTSIIPDVFQTFYPNALP